MPLDYFLDKFRGLHDGIFRALDFEEERILSGIGFVHKTGLVNR